MSFVDWLFGRRSAIKETSGKVPRMSQELFQATPDERRHRVDVPYALPKDIMEGERLNLQHYLFRYALKGNYAAPLAENITQILDVGSGTGIWGKEMTREFPAAHVYGLDLEPSSSVSLSATATAQPANYTFVEGNILQGLPFADNVFDFTHQRMLALALPTQSWIAAIRELVRVTRPGGWVELLEIGATINNAGPASLQLLDWICAMLGKRGIDPKLMEQLYVLAEQAGLKQPEHRYLDLPVGAWDTHVGVLLEKDCLAVFDALKPAVCAQFNLPVSVYDATVQAAPLEWQQNRCTYRFSLVYGQV